MAEFRLPWWHVEVKVKVLRRIAACFQAGRGWWLDGQSDVNTNDVFFGKNVAVLGLAGVLGWAGVKNGKKFRTKLKLNKS